MGSITSNKWLLSIVIGSVLITAIAVTANPVYALAGSLAFVLAIVSITIKFNLPKTLSLIAITLCTCFNVFNDTLGAVILASLIAFYGLSYMAREKSQMFLSSKGFNSYFLIFLAWLVYAAAQMMWVVHTPRTWSHFQTLVIGVVTIWLMTQLINSSEWLAKIYKIWGYSVLVTLLVGWWEIATGNHLARSGAEYYHLTKAASVAFFNPNDFCFFLILSLPVMFRWVMDKNPYRFLGVFMLTSSFYFMFIDKARFLLLVLIVALFAFMVSLAKNRKKLFIFFIACTVSLGYFYYPFIEKAFHDVRTIGLSDGSTDLRGFLTMSAWRIFGDHIFGVGPGNLEYYMQGSVHNFWVEVLVNYGAFIFIGLIAFFVVLIRKLYKAMQSSERSTVVPVFWSAVIFVPTCLESSSIFQFNIIWFLFGLMICALNIANQSENTI